MQNRRITQSQLREIEARLLQTKLPGLKGIRPLESFQRKEEP